MVPRALTFTFWILLFALPGARADLQLKPQTGEYELDGVTFHRVIFTDGERRITYTPPVGWEYSGTSDRFTLHPKLKSEAEAAIIRTGLTNPTPFDDETMKRLTEDAWSSLPSGASQVEIVAQEKNPLIIEQKETFLVVINYNFVGQPQTRSVMFLNRGKEQLRFQLTCRRGDFKELQKTFLGSHYSWQNL